MNHSGIANRWNADLIDQNYAIWQSNPQALDAHWQAFFEGFTLAHGNRNGHSSSDTVELDGPHLTDASKQARAIGLIYAYRSIGHTIAKINPLAKEAPQNPRLTLERLGFNESDLDHVVHTGNYYSGTEITIRDLIERLERTYCHTIGAEYIHIQETPKRRWIQARIEPECFKPRFSKSVKKRILRTVIEAETFENFLQNRYVGQKRFSLEGGET